MTTEILEKANQTVEEIESLKAQRATVSDESFLKKGSGLRDEVVGAGKSAMLAVLDEAIEYQERMLAEL